MTALQSTRSPVNLRSVLLGLAGVVFVCGLTPYNDFAVNNTYLVGNYLPTGPLLFFTVFIVAINGPMRRWWPTRAFSSGEIAVALGMTLVSCALPSSGLMRYLPTMLVVLWYHAGGSGEWQAMLRQLDLPQWMFPTMSAPPTDVAARANDPVIQNYWGRVPIESNSFIAHVRAVPWSAWATPALTWGLLLAALFGAVLCLAVIVRRQWTENERLSFPLATLYLALIEEPQPGRSVNALFHSRSFWIAGSLVFLLHSINALHSYVPGHVPLVPLTYDLGDVLSNEPWVFLDWSIKKATLLFSVIGVMYFVQLKTSFSLWFIFLVAQAGVRMMYGAHQGELTVGMQSDQWFGGTLAFAMALLWIGRSHWASVARQMMVRSTDGEADDRYLPLWAAGWGLAACALVLCAWLVVAGMTIVGAIVLVAMVLMIYMVAARIVAESGVFFVQLNVDPVRPWTYLLNDLPGGASIRTAPQNYFFSNFFRGVFTHDQRETLPTFAIHSMRVADESIGESTSGRAASFRFFAALVLALIVGYVVSGASMLYTEYTYASTLDQTHQTPLSPWAAEQMPKAYVLGATRDFLPPNTGPREAHSRLSHFTIGAVLVACLSALRLRFITFPLHPIGFLLCYSYPMQMIWLSVLVGWLAKALILRFGGVELFRKARFAFIGLIFGEAAASAVWLIVSLVLNSIGKTYYPIRLFPA